MKMPSIFTPALVATILACAGPVQATIVCDEFIATHGWDGKLSVLAFVPATPGATADATRASRQTFQLSLQNKLQSFASSIRRSSRETLANAMTFEPFVCDASNRITDPRDFVFLAERHAVGAVWSDPASATIVNVSIVLPGYAVANNLRDASGATISIEYRLPEAPAPVSGAFDPEQPPFPGVYAFGLGTAYLEAKRYVAARYSLCMSRTLIVDYLKTATNEDSKDILKDLLKQLDGNIAEAAKGLTDNRLEEPQAVYAMCVAAKPTP